SFVNVPRSIASYVLRGDWVQSTSFLTAHERNRRGNRRGGAHANQGQRDPAAPGFGDAVRHNKSNAERQCRGVPTMKPSSGGFRTRFMTVSMLDVGSADERLDFSASCTPVDVNGPESPHRVRLAGQPRGGAIRPMTIHAEPWPGHPVRVSAAA